MTVEELTQQVAEIVDCGCCPVNPEACRKVAEFVRSQYNDVELDDEEVTERIYPMMDDLYNYELFTRERDERAGNSI